jgi:heme/copper-type cytochrome/quinol oxidase subunit 3
MDADDQISTDVFDESPEVHERNLRIGVRVLAGSTILFFFAFAFAYFYLRALDSHGRWNASDAAAPDGFGVAITGLFVLSAAALSAATSAARRDRPWLARTGVALAAVVVAIVVQGIEYANVDFAPHDGGFTSVFYGWTALFAVVALGAVYWIAVLVAEGSRSRTADTRPVPPGLEEAALYLQVLATIGVIAWVLLYLV